MRIIIGLGNPGKKYGNTRHNAGFSIIDAIQKDWNFPPFSENERFSASLSEGSREGERIILAKPMTFMNLSGHTVQALLNFYKLAPSDILVIHDDLDLPLGTCRIATDSSAAGHNGVQNIIEMLGTQAFRRLRVGIGRPPIPGPSPADFVLMSFSQEEINTFQSLLPSLIDTVGRAS